MAARLKSRDKSPQFRIFGIGNIHFFCSGVGDYFVFGEFCGKLVKKRKLAIITKRSGAHCV